MKETEFELLAKEPGYEALALLISSWDKVAEKIANGARLITLPNCYFSIEDGYEVKPIIDSLTDFLQKKNLLFFEGPVPSYIFYFDYSLPDDPDFVSLRNLSLVINNDLCKFGHAFSGVIAVDISPWVERNATSERKFRQFVSYMSGLDDCTLAVYIDQERNETKTKMAYKALLKETRLNYYRIQVKTPLMALKIFNRKIEELGFTLSEEAKNALLKIMETIIALPYSEGPLTITQMAEDVVYDLYKADKPLMNTIDIDSIQAYLPNGSWLKEFAINKGRSIGLIGD